MMSNMIPISNALPSHLAQYSQQNEIVSLSEGIQNSFAVISIRGKVFRIKNNGIETPAVDPATGAALGRLDLTIISANPKLSKTFYADSYKEGSEDPPDCASENGIYPDASVTTPYSPRCDTCSNNEWGSAVSSISGKKIQACRSSKHLAVVPASTAGLTIAPVYLLTVPADSLRNLAEYAAKLQDGNRPFGGVVTSVAFDVEASHPLLKFDYVRDLNEVEFVQSIDESKKASTDTITGKLSPNSVPPVTPVAPVAGFAQPAQPVAPVAGFAQPAQPVAPTSLDPVQPANNPALDVDAAGQVWDATLHTKAKTKMKNGTWKKRRADAAPVSAAPVTAASAAPVATVPTNFVGNPPPQNAVPATVAPVVPEAGGDLEDELEDIMAALEVNE